MYAAGHRPPKERFPLSVAYLTAFVGISPKADVTRRSSMKEQGGGMNGPSFRYFGSTNRMERLGCM